MLSSHAVPAYSELARDVGEDGHTYIVRPLTWDLEKVERYWEKFSPFNIFSDDLPHNVLGFLYIVTHMQAIWFDIYDQTANEVVGVMYLTDMIPSVARKGFIQGTWHACVWDAKAGPRRRVARKAIKALMGLLQIHRLQVEIPLNASGAIRNAKKLGFVEEGVMRQARRIKGQWFNVLMLSLLDSEVEQWEV